MKRFLSILGLAIAFLLFNSIQSYACSCALPDPKLSLDEKIQQSLKNTEAVFSGEVINIEKASEFALKITIRIEDVWKGDLPEVTTLITGIGKGDCGFSFETERTYLIYANGNLKKNSLTVGICSRTNVLAQASEDLKVLGKGKLPKKSLVK